MRPMPTLLKAVLISLVALFCAGLASRVSAGSGIWDSKGPDDTDRAAFRTFLPLFLVHPPSFCDGVSEIPLAECQALVALYNSTNGPGWTRRDGWLATNTPCSWYGVTCEGEHVYTIFLDSNQLRGPIPDQLGKLANLSRLELDDNQLNGAIPPELGNMAELDLLFLDNNQLSGQIPFKLGELGNLSGLHLENNRLSGPIPEQLGDLARLYTLYLDGNELSGTIPPALGNLVHLEGLGLSNNRLTGSIPPVLGNCGDLRVLDLSHNQLSGTIPYELGKLVSLIDLDLSSNQVEGNIPTELGDLTRLIWLHLDRNQLEGEIPSELGKLKNLWQLNLSHNQLEGEIPSELGDIGSLNLRDLDVSYNQLSGPLPQNLMNLFLWSFYFNDTHLCEPPDAAFQAWLDSILDSGRTWVECTICDAAREIPRAECDALVSLYNSTNGPGWTHREGWLVTDAPCSWYGITCQDGRVAIVNLQFNQLSGFMPAELGNLSNLQELDLSYNQLSGAIPSELSILTNLKKLVLYFNQLRGGIPAELGELSNLQNLDLNWNLLSGVIPSELGTLANLEELNLYHNQLIGLIPPELGNLAKLRLLHLGDNQLSGAIPPELGNLVNLRHLILYLNRLSARIPKELGNLANLEGLHLDYNQFSNAIPVELCNLTNLQRFHLHGNRLSGAIPPCLGNLANLLELGLYSNRLSGAIPRELGQLAKLQWLTLDSNQLSGEIPLHLGGLISLDYLSLTNNQLSGKIPSELGKLANLRSLTLSGNLLSGSIPAELGKLTNLEGFSVTNNLLSDSIPSELGDLTNLVTLRLSDNPLSGSLPYNLTNLDLDAFWFQNTNLCEPPDAAFQDWLAGIPELFRTGVPCPVGYRPLISILVDDFSPQPNQGEQVYFFNRLDGDRGAVNNSIMTWGRGQVTTTIAAAATWGGGWMSLNHPLREELPIDFSAILPAQIQPPYQSQITGVTARIARGTPGKTFRLELKDHGAFRWTGEVTLDGAEQAVSASLPPLENINELVWVLDGAAGGDTVVLDSIAFTATTRITDTATAAFVWSYGQLLHNWNPETGLARDKGRDASGEFDAVQVTGSLAAATAMAAQLGIVAHDEAVAIVDKIGQALLVETPRFHGLWPHFVRVSSEGAIEIVPGTEWSSVDTVIAAIGLLTAQNGLGLDASATEQMLRDIDWADLTQPDGMVSMGYTYQGERIPWAWDIFGGESWLVELAYASATGDVAPLTYPSPPTANGSGFIDELSWLFVPPPTAPDYWGADWAAYRTAAADKQVAYYPSNDATSCFAQLGLFGLSAGEVPDPSLVPPSSIYQAFGVGGRDPRPNDGAALLGAPVVVPHYAALIASLRPDEAIQMWEWLIENGFFTPLNNVESLLFPSSAACEPGEAVWNHMKGSWNLALQTLGWGRYLAQRQGQTPILWQAATENPMLRDGYCVLTRCGPTPTPTPP